MDTVTQSPCEFCGHPVDEGEEMKGMGEFIFCADFDECVENKRRPKAPAREAGAEHNEDPETGGRE